MSTKRFCDFCDNEIPSDRGHDGTYNSKTTLRRKAGYRSDELNVAIRLSPSNEAASMPDICCACLFKAVREVDPNPRDESDA